MRLVLAISAIAALAGCSSAQRGPSAEQQYRIVERNGASLDDLCREARKVAQAYLDDRNEPQYQLWHSTESLQCESARLGQLPGRPDGGN